MRKSPIEGGGAVVTVTDITERKQAEHKLADAYDVISSSIDYAANIQQAILPSEDILNAVLTDHFVVWEPRDTVGGDLYLCRVWGDGFLIMLGDCTGHGVPGAFMTMISTGALDNALTDTVSGETGVLLQRLHQVVRSTLGQNEADSISDDGMELGLCYVGSDMQSVVFSGAKFDLFIHEGDEISVIKGTKKAIGYRNVPKGQEYDQHVIDGLSSKTFYMTSDGLIDQVGGERKRGFGKKRFRQLLLDIQEMPMSKQGEHIYQSLEFYQGDQKRRDDIAVIGFKI
ncbi:PAS domain S-box (fragment) [Candidatus Terasakiella magnetica]|uniref:PAS domain S-box n=2 Tax=Candidatus Terasakiella magnetica TaxID=1867952 RepID=A0A1C3RI68_9PROT